MGKTHSGRKKSQPLRGMRERREAERGRREVIAVRPRESCEKSRARFFSPDAVIDRSLMIVTSPSLRCKKMRYKNVSLPRLILLEPSLLLDWNQEYFICVRCGGLKGDESCKFGRRAPFIIDSLTLGGKTHLSSSLFLSRNVVGSEKALIAHCAYAIHARGATMHHPGKSHTYTHI